MKFKFKSEFILATSEIGSGYIEKVEISISSKEKCFKGKRPGILIYEN